MEQLSLDEKENIYHFNDDKLQKHALLTRTLVRTTLVRYTSSQLSPKSLEFKKNEFGKPELLWAKEKNWEPPSLQFNISHTPSLIACAVTSGAVIGIDIEEKQRKTRNNTLSFARRYFSPAEVQILEALTDPDVQQKEFIKLWTMKEAYVKALGRGFWAAPFRDFTIRFRATEGLQSSSQPCSPPYTLETVLETSSSLDKFARSWRFALFELANTHYGAICMEREDHVKDEQGLIRLKAWKTIPFLEDEFVSGTDAVIPISGLTTS
ncbi:4'-phosphopantetheinyl transferase [Nymphaea thermarum]|nr:4'-phosphopantetheinyl transferase [Nymphaea thermarum]